jgi:hypothetical protein
MMLAKRYPEAVLSLLVLFVIGARPVSAQQGAFLYEAKCSRCHMAFAPEDYPAEEWPGIVRSMKAQAALTAEEVDILSDYLVSESDQSPADGVSYKPVLGGYLYTEYFQTPEAAKNFDIHYLALYTYGWVSEKIFYFGEFELEHGGTGGSNTFVEQAYLDYWFTSNLALKIGAILTPFNRFDEFHDPISNFIVTRPQVSREIGVSAWKDVGLDFHGYFNLTPKSSLGFDLYSINGLGSGANLRGSRQYRDNNEDLPFGGRLNFMYGDMLEVGSSLYQGKWDDDGLHNLNLLGAHLLLKTDFADIYGEYSSATSENATPSTDGEMSGYFIQASRLFSSRYRTTVRYGALDYLDTGDQSGRDPAKGDKDLSELALGFTYYPSSKVAFKIEYNLFAEGDRAIEKDNDQLGLQVAVKF